LLNHQAGSGQSSLALDVARGPTSATSDARITMWLWTMDVWVSRARILTDCARLRTILSSAARLGGVKVLGEEFCVFDNAAVTGVLVLAQSHLSIHTWPEYALANVDLLTYGSVDGDAVMNSIARDLGAQRVKTTCIPRARG
jgi:S-adenosylmethionine decarboxylase